MISADNLWKRFGSHQALQGLSLSVPEGSAYALIGANGAGKTTAIRVLMNIFEAERGSVLGVDSRRISQRVGADRICLGKSGYPQDADGWRIS